MPILSQAEVEADLEKAAPAEYIAAGTEPHPYLLLSDYDFARMTCQLFQTSAPIGQTKDWERATLMIRGADAGRDVVLLRGELVTGVVQCKRLESAISLPAVFRELAKLILYPAVDSSLPKIAPGLRYVLALAKDPAATVVAFFDRPTTQLADKADAVHAAVEEVLETYASLAGGYGDPQQALAEVTAVLPTLKYDLLRPHHLDAWLDSTPSVSSRFFRQRLVVDNSFVERGLAQIMAGLGTLQGQVGLLTDEDLKIIKARIEQTLETHRANFGFAAAFGFPREMFAGEKSLNSRVGRLAGVLQELSADYADWLFDRGFTMADEICLGGEALYSHPFARLLPKAFFGYVVADILRDQLSGEVMGGILAKLTGQVSFPDDDARLAAVRGELVAQGGRYLVGDFSKMVGDEDLMALKKDLAKSAIQGLSSVEDIERVLDAGIALMKPKLLEGATELRRLGAYRTSVFLMGVDAIDEMSVLKQMGQTVQALDALKKSD